MKKENTVSMGENAFETILGSLLLMMKKIMKKPEISIKDCLMLNALNEKNTY